jgi:hypothetical protein
MLFCLSFSVLWGPHDATLPRLPLAPACTALCLPAATAAGAGGEQRRLALLPASLRAGQRCPHALQRPQHWLAGRAGRGGAGDQRWLAGRSGQGGAEAGGAGGRRGSAGAAQSSGAAAQLPPPMVHALARLAGACGSGCTTCDRSSTLLAILAEGFAGAALGGGANCAASTGAHSVGWCALVGTLGLGILWPPPSLPRPPLCAPCRATPCCA